MEAFRAGYARVRQKTEKVGDKVMRQALNSQTEIREKLHEVRDFMHMAGPKRQYTIAGRDLQEECQLSEGGFAFVWKVRDLRTDEELVVKKIVCQDAEKEAMVRREVQILERLPKHPNVVKYYGHVVRSGDRGSEAILLFELCPGGHLLDLLERDKGVLSEECILSVFSELVTAVAFLHDQRPPIQHRDLKVENVLLGADGRFKLCDFGSWSDERSDPSSLDKKGMSDLQETIDRYTTMMYRPPEMVDLYLKFTISEKVDIWMLGCIVFTLMFYRHPFQDEGSLAIANARYAMPAQPRHSLKLQDLCHWLLARDPADRPSARQILDAIAGFGDDAPLPLPGSVIARREQQRRLYEDGLASARRPGSPASRAASGSHRSSRSGVRESPSHRSSGLGRSISFSELDSAASPCKSPRKRAGASPRKSTYHPAADGGFSSVSLPLAAFPADWPAATGSTAPAFPEVPQTSRGWAAFDDAPSRAAEQVARASEPWGDPWGDRAEGPRGALSAAKPRSSSQATARLSRRGSSVTTPWSASPWPPEPAVPAAGAAAQREAAPDHGGSSFWDLPAASAGGRTGATRATWPAPASSSSSSSAAWLAPAWPSEKRGASVGPSARPAAWPPQAAAALGEAPTSARPAAWHSAAAPARPPREPLPQRSPWPPEPLADWPGRRAARAPGGPPEECRLAAPDARGGATAATRNPFAPLPAAPPTTPRAGAEAAAGARGAPQRPEEWSAESRRTGSPWDLDASPAHSDAGLSGVATWPVWSKDCRSTTTW